jgi:hypothetical protein
LNKNPKCFGRKTQIALIVSEKANPVRRIVEGEIISFLRNADMITVFDEITMYVIIAPK